MPDEQVVAMTVYRTPDETAEIEARRLEHLSALFDTSTIARLRRLGAAPGWHCLDVGAGSGSVARALAALVAPEGEVLATDLDDRFLGEDEPHLEFRVHDITRDELPEAQFDLAHARGVLEHVRDREAGCARRRTIARNRPDRLRGGVVSVHRA